MVSVVAHSNTYVFADAVTATLPAGTQNGDLLLFWVTSMEHRTLTSPPGGLTQINTGVTGYQRSWLYRRIAASEPANYTWTFDGPQHQTAMIVALRGADPDDPIAITGTWSTVEDTTTLNLSGITADDFLLAIYGGRYNQGTVGTLTVPGMTAIADFGSSSSPPVRAGMAWEAGPTSGGRTVTHSGAILDWRGVLLSIAPGDDTVDSVETSLDLEMALSGTITPPHTDPVGAVPPPGAWWEPYFEDHFTSLDTSTWWRYHHTYGDGFGTLDHQRPENLDTADSVLTISSKRESYEGRDFTSGFISTAQRGPAASPDPGEDVFFPRAGYYEIRARVQHGQGLLPAFWLRHRDGASTAEVDIMEYFHSQRPGQLSQTLHLDGNSNAMQVHTPVEDPQDPGWHVYGLSIAPEHNTVRFRFYLDGEHVGSHLASTHQFWNQHPDALLWDLNINTHVGGDPVGHPDDDPLGRLHTLELCAIGFTDTGYPGSCAISLNGVDIQPWDSGDATYEIDYVRVWELLGEPLAERHNNLEAGTAEATIAENNSGGGTNTPFDTDVAAGVVVFSDQQAAHGALSALSSVTGQSNSTRGWFTNSEPWGRIYIHPTSLPNVAVQFARFSQGDNDIRWMLRLLPSGAIAITDAGFTNLDTSTPISTDNWYRVEWHATLDAIEVRVYELDSTTPMDTLTANPTLQPWDRVRFGISFSSSQTWELYWDDVALSAFAWLGPVPEEPIGSLTGSLGLELGMTGTLSTAAPQLTSSLPFEVDLAGTLTTPPADVGTVQGLLALLLQLGGSIFTPSGLAAIRIGRIRGPGRSTAPRPRGPGTAELEPDGPQTARTITGPEV